MKKYRGFGGSGMNDSKISKTVERKAMANLMRDYMTSRATQQQKQAIVAVEVISSGGRN